MAKDRVGSDAARTLPNNFVDALVGLVIFLPGRKYTPIGSTSPDYEMQWKCVSCSVNISKTKGQTI